ncbi:related to Type 2C Protein Phosphatase [Cephalotrichum gorgonifer]|uniref:Related to Type 2C Protein Phosphatase n=1 Tax=Cephalotrichum gorgonifer TaxID=2041049 RepID=A0AAE8MRT9_9PEZI|nr:related to Type 2C Protein Phosphatase [Cephalotrichum gorgonifer]
MHRIAVRAIRRKPSVQPSTRTLLRASTRRIPCLASRSYGAGFSSVARYNNKSSRPEHAIEPLRSSMYIRRFSVALVSSLVGYGAWYSYKGANPELSSAAARGFSSTQTTGDAAPTRTVLVIGADELRTGTVVGDGPLTKVVNGRKVIEMLSPEQVDEKLRENEESYFVNRGQDIVRYDITQLASNNPIEDDHAEKIVEVPSKIKGSNEVTDWMFWGVFDGHSGWTTSAKLRNSLINYVARELNETYLASSDETPAASAVEAAIKSGFTTLDDEICHKSVEKVFKENSKTLAADLLAPALSGSCALLSFYDPQSKLLRVACTGDSRAVLGRRTDGGKWTATALSVDQTGSNPDEEARMRKLHPDEPKVIHNGRVLGSLEPTRAFGDAVYKWNRDVADRLKRSFFARTPSPRLLTPPYVTAEPVVTTTKISPENGDFLVLATDGLWEMLTNEEVVGLVGKWLETHHSTSAAAASATPSQFDSLWSRLFGSQTQNLPVEKAGAKAGEGQKTPIRLEQWGISPDEKGRFVVRDENAATHLVRNALGGKNAEQVSALLTLPSPFSRRYRDDLTVQVIFFGNGPKNGGVTLNLAATAPTKEPKPKL